MAKITKKSNTALSWFNNVAKSLGYSSSDLITSLMPSSIEFVSSNVSSAKDIIRELRSMRADQKRLSDNMEKDDAVTEVKKFVKNAMDDLKTGKFYNKEREDAVFGFGDEEFSFSDEFGIDDDLFKEDSVEFNDKHITINKNDIVINQAPSITPVMKTLEGQTKAIIRSAEATNNVNISLATKKMIMNKKFGDNVMAGISAINDNLSLLVNFQNDSMSKYISASLKYYEENLNILNRTLEEIKKTTTIPAIKAKDIEDDFATALLASDTLDLKGYATVVKKNISKVIQDNIIASMIVDIFKDKEMRDSILASPLKFIPSAIISSLIPGNIKRSMEDLDKSISSFFPALFMKVNRLKDNFDNPLLQLVGQIFGIETKTKTYVNTSAYHKGPVPFDGYTRKAITEVIPTYLRKILSALTDANEMYYDYGKGEFRTLKDIKGDFEKREKDAVLSSFSEVRDELLRRMEAIHIENDQERKAFKEGIDKFFMSLANQDKLINPRKTKDKYGFDVDELEGVYRFNSDAEQKMFRQLILSLPRNLQMRMFGSNVVEARRAMERFYRNAEENYIENNAMYIFDRSYSNDFKPRKSLGGTPINRDLDDTEKKQSSSTSTRINLRPGQRSYSSFYDIDLTDRELGDYINTYIAMQDGEGDIRRSQKGGFFRWVGGMLSSEDRRNKYNDFLDKVDEIINKPAQMLRLVVDKIDYSLYKIIFGADDENEDKGSITGLFINKIKQTFSNFSKWMSTKILDPLHDKIFGKDGLVEKFKNSEFFKSAQSNLTKLGNYLFGSPDEKGKRQGGLFSDTANQFLDMFDHAKYYFTGKAYTNRAGVSFPDNEKSVFGELKSMFGGFKNTLKEYLFGKEKAEGEDGEKQGGVFSNAIKAIQQGFNNFAEALFGPRYIKGKENKNYQTIRELTEKIKERAPKSLAYGILGAGATIFTGGNLGLLGSLLLPGGPIGGAIVGTTLGFLSQSERFKDWLFGPEVDGERTGGVISKRMQDFFKEHKTSIIGGATLGALKSTLGIGLLPSFLLPGGPIGGAIAGMGFSIIKKSKWFNELVFGTEDEDGKRLGGLLSGLYNKIKFKTGENKNLFGNMAAGALGGAALGTIVSKFGLLGAMLVPGGPLGTALIGAASGFALSSEKWKKIIFGEFDEDEQIRKGGLLGKFMNWTKLEIFEPLKLKVKEIGLNVQEWFTKSIANPFLEALDPIKHEIKKMVDNVKSMFKSAWESVTSSLGNIFEKHVAQPLGKFMSEHVLDPMKKFMSRLIGGIGKIFGSILSAPFKMLNSVAVSLQGKHEREGVRAYREREWSDIMDFKGRRERGERLGFFGGLRRIVGMYTDREAIEDAKYSEDGASYAREAAERKRQREEKQQQRFDEKRAQLQSERQRLNKRIALARGRNYEDESRIEVTSRDVSELEDQKITPVVTDSQVKQNDQKIVVRDTEQKRSDDTSKSEQVTAIQPQVKESKQEVERQPGVSVRRSDSGSKYSDSKQNVLSQISSNVKIIAQEVKGQLDGVGSNTYKIRRILQKQYGVSDNDITGSANRDRIGFLGKIRRAMFQPFDSLKEMLMKPVKFFTDSVTRVGNALLSIPKTIFNTFKTIGKEVFSVFKDTMVNIVKIPLAIVQGMGEAAKIAVEGLKMIGPAIAGTIKSSFTLLNQFLKSFGTMLFGAANAFSDVLVGIGSGLGDIIKSIGSVAGSLMTTFGKMLGKIVPMVGGMLTDATKQLTKFTFNVVSTITEAALDIIKTPFELIGGLFGKVTGRDREKKVKSEVTILGGRLDVVDKVKENVIIRDLNVKSPIPVKIISTVSELPVRVVNFNTANEKFGAKIDTHQLDITKAFSTALEKFDEADDKEEEEKRIKLAEEDKLKAQKRYLTRKSASFMQQSRQIEAEREFTQNNEIAQTSYLKSISDNMKGYVSSWSEIFSKKGLITMAILAAIPIVSKIWDWLRGWFGDGDASPMPANVQEAIIKGAAKKGIQLGQKIYKVGKAFNKGFKWVKKKLGFGVAEEVAEEAVEKGAKIAVRETAEKAAKEGAEKIAVETVEEIAEKGSIGKAFNKGFKWVKKKLGFGVAEEVAEEAVEKGAKIAVRETAEKAAKEGAEKIAVETVEEIAEKGSKGVLDFIINVIKKIFTNKKVRAEIGEEVAEKAGKEVIEKLTKTASKSILQKIGIKLSEASAKLSAKTAGAAASAGLTELVFGIYNFSTGLFEAHRLFDVHPDEVDGNMRIVSATMKTILGIGWMFVLEIINEVLKEMAGVDFIKMIAMIIYKCLSSNQDYDALLDAQRAFEREVQVYNEMNKTDYTVEQYQDKYYKSIGQKITGGLKWALIDKPYEFGMALADGYYNLKDKFSNWKDSHFSDEAVKRNLGVTGDGQITKSMRAASATSELLEMSTFGLLKSEDTTRFIHGVILSIQDAFKFVGDLFGRLRDGVEEGAKRAYGKAKEMWDRFTDGIRKAITWVDDKVLTPIKTGIETIGNKINQLWGSFYDSLYDKGMWIDENVFVPVKEKFHKVGEAVGKGYDKFLTSLDEKVLWLDEKVFRPIKVKIEGLGRFIGDVWNGIVDAIVDKFGWLYNLFTNKSAEDLKEKGFKEAEQSIKSSSTTSKSTTTKSSTSSNKSYKYVPGYYATRTTPYSFRGGQGGGFGDNPDRLNNFTYFSQNDPRWASEKYDHSPQFGTKSNNPTIAYRGCGPTSMAMVATELTGKLYTPPYFARIAEEGGHSSNSGTHWSFFKDVERRFGFDMFGVEGRNDNIIRTWLKTGMPVILSGQKKIHSKSPFTDKGHFVVATGLVGNKIMINDPRGTNHSGEYDFNKVMQETLGGWAFRYDGKTPPPSGYQGSILPSEAEGPQSIFDIFGNIRNVFEGYRDLMLYGKLMTVSEGNNQNITVSGTPMSSFIDYNNPTFSALKNAVIKKALETTVGHESRGRYTVANNDVSSSTGAKLSPSIGLLQWRVGNAKTLMERMYELLPNDPEAKYFAKDVDWYNEAPWSETQLKRLRDYLEKNYDITKKVQDQFAMEYMANTNFSEVEKHAINSGKLKDPRAIAFLTNFANTGPALVKSFMEKYTPSSRGDEFEHFYNEFMTKSYWGQKKIYKSRIDSLYNELKSWDPGVTGGYGDGDGFRISRDDSLFGNKNTTIQRHSIDRFIDDAKKQLREMSGSGKLSDELLIKIIALLEDISGNTKLATEELSLLNKKETKVEVVNQSKESQPTVVKNTSNYSNPFYNIVEEQRKNRLQKEYKDAKDIAKGR